MQVLIFCALGLKTLIQNWDFGDKIGEGLVQCWPPTNSFLLRCCYLCATFGDNRSRNATVRMRTDGQTDGHTHWQRQTEFNNLSHAVYCSYGADNDIYMLCKHAARHTCSHTWNDHCIADWNQQFHGHLSQPSTFSNSLCYKQVENSKYAEHTSRH